MRRRELLVLERRQQRVRTSSPPGLRHHQQRAVSNAGVGGGKTRASASAVGLLGEGLQTPTPGSFRLQQQDIDVLWHARHRRYGRRRIC